MSQLGSDTTEPVATGTSVPDAAGFGDSTGSSDGTVQPLRRGPVFPWLRALLVMAIIGVGMSSPLVGSIIVPFGTALIALALARGANRLFVAACIAGSGIVAAALTMSADVHDAWVNAAVLAAVFAALLGIEHWRAALPDLDADSTQTWPEPQVNRGVTYATFVWLVAAALLVVSVGLDVGSDRLSSTMQSTVRTAFADYEDACGEGGVLENDDRTCEQIDDTREFLSDVARDHAPSMFTAFLALVVAGGAWLAHLVVVARLRALAAQHWAVPARPSYRLRHIEFHWSWAYVGILGVVTLIATRELSGATREWVLAAGLGVAAVAGQVLMLQGSGVLAWMLSRRPAPWWYRIVLAVLALILWPFVLGGLLILGALDMWLALRRKAEAAIAADPRG